MVKRGQYSTMSIDVKQNSAVNFTRISIIICILVTFREFRPVEPFMTSFLTSPQIGLTTDEVNEKIYPVGTYSSCVFAIIVFLITDYLRYKPVIILDGLTGIMTYLLLIGRPSVLRFTIEQMFFGFFYAGDIAANTYLYAKIEDPSQYQKITGYVRASSLIGRFLNGIFGQLAVSLRILEQHALMYASIAGMTFVTIWSFAIPSVNHSIYFHRIEKRIIKEGQKGENELKSGAVVESKPLKKELTVVKSEKFIVVCRYLRDDFFAAYTNLYVLKWTVWWTLCLSGYYFVVTYSQVLWQDIANEKSQYYTLLNGAVESVSTIISAFSAYLISKVNFSWQCYGDAVLSIVTIILSLLVLFLYVSHSLWLVYITYITYMTLFQTMLTTAQSEVAQHLKKDSYGLIFGFNQFLSLALGSLITYTIIEGRVIHLTTRQQFLFYGVYYLVIAVLVIVKMIRDICSST